MKIIAFYLPQFHEIPENNQMWGDGFTEWTNVKRAIPMFAGHQQPVEPLNDFYYDLSDISVMKWQTALAKNYGIYGFCFYHYWYNGHKLLHKPIENYLADTSIDFPFCLCWANHPWTMSWSAKENTVIYQQDYSDRQEWKQHFLYMLPYLKDSRYIRIDGKPLLILYEAARIKELNEIMDYWEKLAVENGLLGINFAYESVFPDTMKEFDDSRFKYNIEYQPQYARVLSYKSQKKARALANIVYWINEKTFHIKWREIVDKLKHDKLTVFDYDDLWKHVLSMGPVTSKSVPGAFIKVDTTPRKHERGIVSVGMTPDKLKQYLKLQIKRAKEVYKRDMMFVFAWNEWAEGAYMEPDKQWKYGVLEAVRDALMETGEFPGSER